MLKTRIKSDTIVLQDLSPNIKIISIFQKRQHLNLQRKIDTKLVS